MPRGLVENTQRRGGERNQSERGKGGRGEGGKKKREEKKRKKNHPREEEEREEEEEEEEGAGVMAIAGFAACFGVVFVVMSARLHVSACNPERWESQTGSPMGATRGGRAPEPGHSIAGRRDAVSGGFSPEKRGIWGRLGHLAAATRLRAAAARVPVPLHGFLVPWELGAGLNPAPWGRGLRSWGDFFTGTARALCTARGRVSAG